MRYAQVIFRRASRAVGSGPTRSGVSVSDALKKAPLLVPDLEKGRAREGFLINCPPQANFFGFFSGFAGFCKCFEWKNRRETHFRALSPAALKNMIFDQF